MTYDFSKAFSGGRAVTQEDIRALPAQQLSAMREFFRKPDLERTDDVIEQRLSEDLEGVKRMLENLDHELNGRADLCRQLDHAGDAIEDIADIVGAADKCEAIGQSDDEMKRRILRRSLDGSGMPCDNQTSSDVGSKIRKG
ncbi:hypothetical protein [Altererythrobacter aquiaggeris]|uniref:hypothetical protein n=1 Tax=Aestuarierythrobacter aquiaggeris TaxID=1898396 RepID=UPI003018B12C